MEILSKIDFSHVNSLLLLGLALFGGTFGGKLFQKLKIPQVVGYIIIGIIIGESGFNLIDIKTIQTLSPINSFALGLIGFTMGNELRLSTFKKMGKQFMYILFFEALSAAIFVFVLSFIGASLYYPIKIALGFALLLGPISAATAAAGTTDVLNEYKAKGLLTTTILGIVALDDVLALFIFAITSTIAANLLGSGVDVNFIENLIEPTYEIFGSIILGSISGFILSKLLLKYDEEDKILDYTLGAVLFILGLSVTLKVDMIMSSMIMGTILANMVPQKSKDVFELIEKFAPPIYILFFVFVGAKFNVGGLSNIVILFITIFLIGRTSGKMFGAFLGAKISKAPIKIQKYLPLSLFSQSGVAIGLSIIASQKFQGEVGNTILIVVTTTTFIVQIIGPQFIKIAIHKANEVNKNITIEDLKKETKIDEIILETEPIYENAPFKTILKQFSKTSSLYLPIIDEKHNLKGVITVDLIKELLNSDELTNFLIANDIMENPKLILNENEKVINFFEKASTFDSEYAIITDKNNKYKGVVDIISANKKLSNKLTKIELESQI